MFKRFTANFFLIFLFAVAQVSAATHEISHIGDYTKHSHDKNTHSSQCAQCVSFAEVASGLPSQNFLLPTVSASFIGSTLLAKPALFQYRTAYAARAPPQTS